MLKTTLLPITNRIYAVIYYQTLEDVFCPLGLEIQILTKISKELDKNCKFYFKKMLKVVTSKG